VVYPQKMHCTQKVDQIVMIGWLIEFVIIPWYHLQCLIQVHSLIEVYLSSYLLHLILRILYAARQHTCVRQIDAYQTMHISMKDVWEQRRHTSVRQCTHKTHVCATIHTEDTHLCDNAHFYERMHASVRKYTLLWENALWMIALAWDLVDGIMDNALLLVRPHCTHLWDNPLVWDNAFVWDIAFVSWMKRCFDSDVSWFHGWSAALIETSIPQWLHSRGCAKSHISTMSPTSATIEVLRYWGRISRGALSTQSWEQHTLQHTTTHRNTHCSALQHTLETRARVALVSLLLSFSRMLL